MKLTLSAWVAAVVLATSVASTADAQERRKQSERQREQQQERSSSSNSGLPSCHGGMVFLEEGGVAFCRHRDGRTCEVREGGGSAGQAVIGNCR